MRWPRRSSRGRTARKYGKTETDALFLDPALTSPYAFYQFFLNTADADAGQLLRVFSLRSRSRDRGDGAVDRRAPAGASCAAVAGRGADHHAPRRRPGASGDRRLAGDLRPGRAAAAGRGDRWRGRRRGAACRGGRRAAVAHRSAGGERPGQQPLGGAPHRHRGRRLPEQRAGRRPGAAAPAEDLLHGRWLVLRRGKRTVAVVERRS